MLFTPSFLRGTRAAVIPYGSAHVVADHYGDVTHEYQQLTTRTGVIAATHRGMLRIEGKDRLKFLQSLITQDVKSMAPGAIAYSFMLNIKGRIIADMVLVALDDGVYVDTDARLAGLLTQTLERYLFSDAVVIEDVSGRLVRMTVMGPEAAGVLAAAIPGIQLPGGGHALQSAEIQGWIYRRDIMRMPQWELAVGSDLAADIWQQLTADGRGCPVGWSAFNIARVAAGAPWYGIDMTDQHLPMETGPAYQQAVHLSKGCYIGQEVVARMHSHQTVARALVAMDIKGDGLPSVGAAIYDGEQVIGNITSAAPSPERRGDMMALGYVKKSHAGGTRPLMVQTATGRAPAALRPL
jgi:folate-binding protein YgfZ